MARLTAEQAFDAAMQVHRSNYIEIVDGITDNLYGIVNETSLNDDVFSIIQPVVRDLTHTYDFHMNLYSMVEKRFIDKGYRCINKGKNTDNFLLYISWRYDIVRKADIGDFPYN